MEIYVKVFDVRELGSLEKWVGEGAETTKVVKDQKFVSFCLHSVSNLETEWRQNGDKWLFWLFRLVSGQMYLRHCHRLLGACHPRIDVHAICSTSPAYITSELKTPHRSDWQARRDIMLDLPGIGASTTGTSVSSTIHVLSCRSISGPWGCTYDTWTIQ